MSRRIWRRRRPRLAETLLAAAMGVGAGAGVFYVARLLLGRTRLDREGTGEEEARDGAREAQ